MKYGAILRACRERIGLSQEEMAEKLFVSRSAVSKIETDKQEVTLRQVAHWLEATNAREVMVSFLCGMDGLSIMQSILQISGVS